MFCTYHGQKRPWKRRAKIAKKADKAIRLKHFFALEVDPYSDDEQGHKRKHGNPGPSCPFKRQMDIHTVETGHQRGRHQKQGDEGEDFHYPVLLQIDDSDHGILHILQPFEGEVDVVYKG